MRDIKKVIPSLCVCVVTYKPGTSISKKQGSLLPPKITVGKISRGPGLKKEADSSSITLHQEFIKRM